MSGANAHRSDGQAFASLDPAPALAAAFCFAYCSFASFRARWKLSRNTATLASRLAASQYASDASSNCPAAS